MSDTTPKKNSIFDKILLGTAAVLAIGMMAVGPRGEAKLITDEKEVEENQGLEKEQVKQTPGAKSVDSKKVAAIQAELKKAHQANATLEAQLRKNKIALEMKKDKASTDANLQALKKAKAALEAKEAELAKLKSKMAEKVASQEDDGKAAKAVEDARAQKEELIKNLENALKKAKSDN